MSTNTPRTANARFNMPAVEFVLWQPIALLNFIVGAMHRRGLWPCLYREERAPLRQLHYKLVRLWMPFYRGTYKH